MNRPTVTRHRRRIRLVPVVAALAATTAGVAITITAGGSAPERPLRYHAGARGLLIGGATANDTLTAEPAWATLLGQEFNDVTPRDALMWDATEPYRGSFTFANGDAVVRFAQAHGQTVRGSALVRHSGLPAWVATTPPAQLLAAMRAHITGLAGHYAGQIHAWDVVSEALGDDGGPRESPWLRAIGPSYVAEAFRAARAADPTARLYLAEVDAEGLNAKSDGLYALVRSLLAGGVPVDGVGIAVGTAPPTLARNLERFAGLGLDVAITQLPAGSADGYRAGLEACLAVPRCVSYTVWNIKDLFDDRLRPTPAYRAVRDALREAVRPPEPAPAGDAPTAALGTLPPTTGRAGGSRGSPEAVALSRAACRVAFSVVSQWPEGFQAEVRVTNATATAVNGWTLRWMFPSGQTIGQLWSGTGRQAGAAVSVSNLDWNARIPPAGFATFGFLASGPAAAGPTGFTLNGAACAG